MVKKPQEIEISDADDLLVWNAAGLLSNAINAAIQQARKQAADKLLTEVVVRALALHVFAVRSQFNLSAADFEARIDAMPVEFRERILLLAVSPKPKGKS